MRTAVTTLLLVAIASGQERELSRLEAELESARERGVMLAVAALRDGHEPRLGVAGPANGESGRQLTTADQLPLGAPRRTTDREPDIDD